ncbi:hypothetical protein C8Q75DRAFT_750232 [Abortiporus biennis]|nr:hypothetical protein C8Q75DRAFT_750232 [Abortiporus biennis]
MPYLSIKFAREFDPSLSSCHPMCGKPSTGPGPAMNVGQSLAAAYKSEDEIQLDSPTPYNSGIMPTSTGTLIQPNMSTENIIGLVVIIMLVLLGVGLWCSFAQKPRRALGKLKAKVVNLFSSSNNQTASSPAIRDSQTSERKSRTIYNHSSLAQGLGRTRTMDSSVIDVERTLAGTPSPCISNASPGGRSIDIDEEKVVEGSSGGASSVPILEASTQGRRSPTGSPVLPEINIGSQRSMVGFGLGVGEVGNGSLGEKDVVYGLTGRVQGAGVGERF